MPKEYDVAATVEEEVKGLSIVQQLLTKGFCVVDSGVEAGKLTKALQDVKEMDGIGKFKVPAELISFGLLGKEGSARIAELDEPGELSTDGDSIRDLDDLMTKLAQNMTGLLADVGIDCSERTLGMVHESNNDMEDPPELTLEEASVWLNTFTRCKVMMIMALGPGKGMLELRPFDEEAQVVELETSPGDLIVLRPDALSHDHGAHGTVNLLSCYMLGPRCFDRSSSLNAVLCMPPPAKILDAWAITKIQQLKSEEKGITCRTDLPADWTSAMNQLAFSGQRVAVRSQSMRCNPSWSASGLELGCIAGGDFVTAVPKTRFDIDIFYDPDPEAWRGAGLPGNPIKTNIYHMCYTDGLDMFDNKFFGLSPAEASGMDPMQNNVLEVGYEALLAAGYTKKKIMNSWGGVYVATESSEWQMVEKTASGSNATGGAASITANRFSFCLGLKGPSIAFSSGNGSGLLAMHTGAQGVLDRGRGSVNLYSLAGGVNFNYLPYFWPQYQAAGLMSATGRCWSFGACADGWLFQDAIGLCVLKPLTEKVDGRDVFIENEPLIGIIAGSRAVNNGASANMNAPSAACEQELFSETCKWSGITPLDVDALECNCEGDVLKDAIEVGSAMRSYRFEVECDQPLAMNAVKANCAHGTMSAGAVSFIRALMSHNNGVYAPQPHLCEMNPHMDFDDFSSIGCEVMDYKSHSSYSGVNSYGYGGTLAHVCLFGQIDKSRLPSDTPSWTREKITYWPGGGGDVNESMPAGKTGYSIAGTFSKWSPVEMEPAGDGVWTYTLTLGMNRWETFQIWLQGKSAAALHPSVPRGQKGSLVMGPAEVGQGTSWMIDGRSSIEYGGLDEAKIGDKFKISLKIAGKYRTVDWVKLTPEEGAVAEKVSDGTYYLAASWNNWTLDEMFRDDSDPNVHYIEVPKIRSLTKNLGAFQIVRNQDWQQTIYPDSYDADSTAGVLGPDDEGGDSCWLLPSTDLPARIELHRSSEGGFDSKSVRWTKL